MNTPKHQTVLVIDDDETLRSLMESMLQHMGYHVLLAESGKQALDISEHSGEDIQIAFMDLFLPDMRGDTVSPKIQEHHPGLKVIMMSGYALDDTNVLGGDVHGFIQKPCTIENLSRVLEALT